MLVENVEISFWKQYIQGVS